MSRFVVLHHLTPAGAERPAHWDLMLEAEGVLRTWALDDEPAAGRATAALRLPDHRLAYLDYEGPIGGGRGEVRRHDAGELEWQCPSAPRIAVALRGKKLRGLATLEQQADDPQRWVFWLSGDAS